MAKFQNDTMLDAALSTIRENVRIITVCSGQPANFSTAFNLKGATGNALARLTQTSANSFAALADGDTNGRKLTINAHSGLTVSATGGGDHVALLSSAGASTLWYITTATSQTLTSGNSLTINAWDIEIADAT
jgi:hypothetical protein